ncbi:polysaccharide deacetylase [Siculibacillus lacustris]|uniref:Polysaccharide deacetylase n=1 Tax=Siculibacillus lacustris TaxID=1549641 RepID=A0A4Q9VWL8_9HYPH|nr:polysaccharide deacetylase [Siculibacillus lacustris]TBW40725.1 polysaccharide deacetylase [Siculibacillus lacustris]
MPPTNDRYGYTPITRSPSFRWPNGANLAIYVCLGIEDYAFGEGLTEDILPGASAPDWVNRSWRDYGNRVGAFRLIDRFAEFGIRPAILLNTDVYDTAPELMSHARRAGAEIVGHGLSNSHTLAGRSASDEEAYVGAVAARIAAEEGAAPGGWSSPWLAQTSSTLVSLRAHGYRYLLDLRLDDRPVWLAAGDDRILALPYALELNDSTTMIGRQTSASEFERMIVDEFDEMRLAARDRPLVMSLVVHSFISGQPFRLRALTRALRHLAAAGDEVWFATPGEIAAFVEADPSRAV